MIRLLMISGICFQVTEDWGAVGGWKRELWGEKNTDEKKLLTYC